MSTPSDQDKVEDAVQGRFVLMREPPGRLGAIVRRLKRMSPPPTISPVRHAAPEKGDAE